MSFNKSVSNAATFVGRHICFLNSKTGKATRKALIIAYTPESREHVVKYDDETEESVALATKQFKWLVKTCEPAEKGNRRNRFQHVVKRDAVGRKVKVYSKTREKWFRGTIIEFEEATGKHKVQFAKPSTTKSLNLEKQQWRYTDIVADTPHSRHSLSSSRFAGVMRSSDLRWLAFRGRKGVEYIGSFMSEKDAALAHDVYARKAGDMHLINFPKEQISEKDIENRKTKQHGNMFLLRTKGKSKYRGVHWQKNRKRWMARYSLSHRGEKNINLGAFAEAEQAAMAFDAEARKRGRPDSHLNFPEEHPTEAQIESWKMNTTHYTLMGVRNKSSSQYRGVSRQKSKDLWHVQCNINKVLQGVGKAKGPAHFGFYQDETQAALVFDRICRRFGVAEKELNFPRDEQDQKEVRLFDDECYFCQKTSPENPVATPCNHVFCVCCITEWFDTHEDCPCCHRKPISINDLRPVELISWQDEVKKKGKKKQKRENTDADTSSETAGATAKARETDDSVSDAESLDTESEQDANSDLEDADDGSDNRSIAGSKRKRSNLSAKSRSDKKPKYSIGTRFVKEFPSHGEFEGKIVGFDGKHYKVYYSCDEDEEELSEYEFDEVNILPGKLKDYDS